jgi:hypothetical protein
MDASNAHTARERKEEALFVEDWKKMSFHGQIRRSQIEPIKLIFQTNFQYLYAVFKKFACMGTDAVFRKATKAMRNLLGADRGTLWLVPSELHYYSCAHVVLWYYKIQTTPRKCGQELYTMYNEHERSLQIVKRVHEGTYSTTVSSVPAMRIQSMMFPYVLSSPVCVNAVRANESRII